MRQNFMIDDMRQHREANPFQPFSIATRGGMKYRVASRDHAGINSRGTRLVVWFDEGGSVTVASLNITAIEEEASTIHTA